MREIGHASEGLSRVLLFLPRTVRCVLDVEDERVETGEQPATFGIALPQFTALFGYTEIGSTNPSRPDRGTARTSEAVAWWTQGQVTYVDWLCERVFVETADSGGTAKWTALGQPLGIEAMRQVRVTLIWRSPLGRPSRRMQNTLLTCGLFGSKDSHAFPMTHHMECVAVLKPADKGV
ncbi:hypothetical protein CUT44_04930 [Streptomyces carminius]|uniref:Uncharacterized protein n=1 Tax=Streptomyces carminius TaxID=2665496 RepID=A0A2M8M5E4_9ACTN|nr:hypothetical protein CUT44_04930 [Streptomyces carminius]